MKQQLKVKYRDQQKFKESQGIADLQYQIWATFLKSTGENLRNRQLRMMADSSALLETFSNSKLFQRDLESTEDSVSQRQQSTFDQESVKRLRSPDSRILARKSPRANNRGFNITYYEQLKDIEQNCNSSTFKWIRNFIEQHKKIKQSLVDIQYNQKRLKRNIASYEKQHESFLIMKKINQQAESKIQCYDNQISELKTKNKALIQQISSLQVKNQQSIVMDHKAITNLNQFLIDKQRSINTKMNKIVSIQENVLEIVRYQISESGCEKCCTFIRRIKDTIMKMRSSLLQQSEQIQNIYNRYKTVFCGGSY